MLRFSPNYCPLLKVVYRNYQMGDVARLLYWATRQDFPHLENSSGSRPCSTFSCWSSECHHADIRPTKDAIFVIFRSSSSKGRKSLKARDECLYTYTQGEDHLLYLSSTRDQDCLFFWFTGPIYIELCPVPAIVIDVALVQIIPAGLPIVLPWEFIDGRPGLYIYINQLR